MALDKSFKPKYNFDLIRLGRDYDGGYIVCKSILNSKGLISLGINNDWSFEKDYFKKINSKILTFDPTTNISLLLDFFFNSIYSDKYITSNLLPVIFLFSPPRACGACMPDTCQSALF